MYETAIPGAGYGYGTQQLGPPGTYGNVAGQIGQPIGLPVGGGIGQPLFGGAGGLTQRFGGYPVPQSVFPQAFGAGAIPLQQIPTQFGQSQFGQSQFGQPQFGQPQFGQPQFGQPQFGQWQTGQLPFAPPHLWQQLGGLQLGTMQPQVQVIPVVTPQGAIGVLLLATGQPLVVGATAGGGLGQYAGYGYGAPQALMGAGQILGSQTGGFGGGYLPLQVQQQIPQQIPQMAGPAVPFTAPSFPGQPPGGVPTIH